MDPKGETPLSYRAPEQKGSSTRFWVGQIVSIVIALAVLFAIERLGASYNFETSLLNWLLGILGFLAALQLIVGPMVVYVIFRMRADAIGMLVDHEDLPPAIASAINRCASAMAELGFSVAGYVKISGMVSGVDSYSSLWCNADTGDMGSIAVVTTAVGKKHVVGFDTAFKDGTRIETGNMKDASSFAHDIRRDKLQVSWIESPQELYRIHRRRVELSGKGRGVVPEPAEALNTLRREIVEELEGQAAMGRLQRTADGTSFRPTLYGAIAMTWGQVWPISLFRKILRKRKVKARIRELGF